MGKTRFFKPLVIALALGCGLLASVSASATSAVTASQTVFVPHGSWPTTITVNCPTGYVVSGGGFKEISPAAGAGGGGLPVIAANNQIAYTIDSYFVVFTSAPTDAGDGWIVTGMPENIDDAQVTVYARCVM